MAKEKFYITNGTWFLNAHNNGVIPASQRSNKNVGSWKKKSKAQNVLKTSKIAQKYNLRVMEKAQIKELLNTKQKLKELSKAKLVAQQKPKPKATISEPIKVEKEKDTDKKPMENQPINRPFSALDKKIQSGGLNQMPIAISDNDLLGIEDFSQAPLEDFVANYFYDGMPEEDAKPQAKSDTPSEDKLYPSLPLKAAPENVDSWQADWKKELLPNSWEKRLEQQQKLTPKIYDNPEIQKLMMVNLVAIAKDFASLAKNLKAMRHHYKNLVNQEDQAEIDIMHKIEFADSLSSEESADLTTVMRKSRTRRRIAKDNMLAADILLKHLQFPDSIEAELSKQFDNRHYSPRVLKDMEI